MMTPLSVVPSFSTSWEASAEDRAGKKIAATQAKKGVARISGLKFGDRRGRPKHYAPRPAVLHANSERAESRSLSVPALGWRLHAPARALAVRGASSAHNMRPWGGDPVRVRCGGAGDD